MSKKKFRACTPLGSRLRTTLGGACQDFQDHLRWHTPHHLHMLVEVMSLNQENSLIRVLGHGGGPLQETLYYCRILHLIHLVYLVYWRVFVSNKCLVSCPPAVLLSPWQLMCRYYGLLQSIRAGCSVGKCGGLLSNWTHTSRTRTVPNSCFCTYRIGRKAS